VLLYAWLLSPHHQGHLILKMEVLGSFETSESTRLTRASHPRRRESSTRPRWERFKRNTAVCCVIVFRCLENTILIDASNSFRSCDARSKECARCHTPERNICSLVRKVCAAVPVAFSSSDWWQHNHIMGTFLAFYGTWMFITVFTTSCHLPSPWATLIQSTTSVLFL
jgi:hypothetical protein